MGVSQTKKYTVKGSQSPQIQIDFKKQIQNQLKIITNWSLQQIREMCLLYKRYSSQCPYLSRFLFKKIIPQFSNTTSNQIFSCWVREQGKYISFYEFVCVVVLTSFNTMKRKLQFLYLVFNLTHGQSLKLKHFILMYESLTFGFCRATDQQPPKFDVLKKFLMEQYLTSQSMEILQSNFAFRKLIQQVQDSTINRQLFLRFQCNVMGAKQKPYVYMLNGLVKYDKREQQKILKIIKKVNQENNYQDIEILEKNKRFRLQNRKLQKLKLMEQDLQRDLALTNNFSIKNRSYSLRKLNEVGSKVIFNGKFNTYRSGSTQFGKLRVSQSILVNRQSLNMDRNLSPLKQNSPVKTFRITVNENRAKTTRTDKIDKQKLKQMLQKKVPSVVFLGGKAYTKPMFFQTIEYFNTLSSNKDEIRIKDFFKTFENKAFLKKQLSTLFNYFDANSNGSISFQQFIKASYPTITKRFFQRLREWNIQYKNIYQADKIIIKKQNKGTKVQLPQDAKQRLRQIFYSFGASIKGYLTYDDIRNAYSTGFTVQQCTNLVKEYGQNGKMYINGFARMLLPEGYSIENCDWHVKKSMNNSK